MELKFTDIFKGPLTYSKFRNISSSKFIKRRKVSIAELSELCNFLILQQKLFQVTNCQKLIDFGYLENEIYALLPLCSNNSKLKFLGIKCGELKFEGLLDCIEVGVGRESQKISSQVVKGAGRSSDEK